MGNDYQAQWADTQRRRDEAQRARAEVLDARRREDEGLAKAREAVEALGLTEADLDRWVVENRALAARRIEEDHAWCALLAEWVDEDRKRQDDWAMANPQAATLLAGMAS
jgi:hypothetical protein